MTNVPNTFTEARAQGITYKAWLYMCEQELIEEEQAEEEEEMRENAARKITEHHVELARAVLHCPDCETGQKEAA